jgi:hypothetical protein
VEQRLARQAHNLEVVGSIPTGATLGNPGTLSNPHKMGDSFALTNFLWNLSAHGQHAMFAELQGAFYRPVAARLLA